MASWILAAFPKEATMAKAADGLRSEGFARLECYTPHPSEGAYAVVPGRAFVAPLVLAGGLFGVGIGFFIQWWANAFNWPIIVGGRPFFSIPTYIPICFECMVLCASFAGLYAFFINCRLPRLHHEFQDSEVFERHTVDRFVIAVRWERPTPSAPLLERLRDLGATEFDEVPDP